MSRADVCVRLAQLVADFPPTFTGTAVLTSVSTSASTTFDSLPTPTITGYAPLPAGTYGLTIAVNGLPALTLSSRFNERQSYTALASGLLSADPKSADFADDTLIADDNTLAPPGTARIRVVHAAPAAGLVDVRLNGQTRYEDIAYKNVSDYQTVTAGTYILSAHHFQTGALLATTENLALAEGAVNTFWLVENRFGGPALQWLPTVDAPNGCSRQNYKGIWFDPRNSGQGVQFNDEPGGSFGGVWYAYGPDRESAWFTFVGECQGNTLSASLLRFTGPPYTEPFDPAQVRGTPAGVVSITFSEATRSAVFQATVEGATTTLDLAPFSLRP